MCCTVSGVHLTGGMLLHANIWNALHEARPGVTVQRLAGHEKTDGVD